MNSLIKPVENCFEEIKVKLSLQLPPMDTQSIRSGTKSMLDRLVFKYKTELGGIIISYYDVVHTDKEAKIFYDSPYLGLNIQVKFLIFKPFKDQILNGVVKRVSSTHISLLVFGTISASIPKSNIPKSFAFDHSSNMFMNKQTKATISVGTKIAFKVIDVSADKHNIGIQGDMTDQSSTGIIGFEENQSQFTHNDNTNNNNNNNKTPVKNNNNNIDNFNNSNSLMNNNTNNITKFNDDSEKESEVEEQPKPELIVKDEPKIVSVKVESKKVVKQDDGKKDKKSSDKKEKESKKRKKVESSSDDEDDSSESSTSEDQKKKKKKKDSKKSKKVVSSDSSSDSSEEEKEKKKKKKK